MPATIRQGSTGEDVKTWQRVIGVTADGSFGPATLAATKTWQAAHGLTADGVVGPKTWEAAEIGTGTRVAPATSGVSVVAYPGFRALSSSDQKAFVKAAQWIAPGEPDAPTWLATIVDFESGKSWRTDVRNPYSRAVGLIQFIEPTAKNLGTTTDALARMSFAQQLEYVKKYFAPVRGKIHSLDDMYLAVFSPKGIGQPASAVLFVKGQAGYDQNEGLDAAGDGTITVGDVTRAVHARLASGQLLGTIAVSMGIGLGTIAILAGIGYAILKWKGGA